MYKLLSANFMRLKKDKVFWLLFIFMFVAGMFFPIMMYSEQMKTGSINNIDHMFFHCAMFIGIIMAIFCSFFVGTEYSDGVIRNKVIAGKKRTDIFGANFAICAIAGVIMCGGFFLPYFCIGFLLLGFFAMDIEIVLFLALTVVILSIAFSSIFNLIAMLNGNKAVTAVACILLSFLLFFTGMKLNQMLSEEEKILGMIMTENGEQYEEFPNPNYLEDEERKIVQFFYDFLPGGQIAQCGMLGTEKSPLLPVYSLIIVLSTTSIGLCYFKKKDLK